MALGLLNCVDVRNLGDLAASLAGAEFLFAAFAESHGDAVRYSLTVIKSRGQLADELCDGDKLAAVTGGVYTVVWVQVRYDPVRTSAEALTRLVEGHGWSVFEQIVSQRHRLIA
ncbi:hypothetical protein GobsT_46800 [Gemmata obscuriglobus]|uniref:Uncharacterized protein n=1 Tax=Gemmata obscuriglobus TaxID=114 RepID=A0A2Z3GVM0_9BACT|nr:hypothetical protein [Gemmata obscuriglobus]AWM37358.1 hypothetical protein C1280_10280 [Gemmata obscuriglobus]QEG29881.1 hypothetical protein GobsT_46800 [Gemmata obscuriglobus]VTS09199.1 unnamed protein product [Gemmata obscuriglobus UQM 2246]